MEFPRLLYRVGTAWALESGRYDLQLVASPDECKAAQADGWHLDQYAARDALAPPPPEPPAEPAPRAKKKA